MGTTISTGTPLTVASLSPLMTTLQKGEPMDLLLALEHFTRPGGWPGSD